MVRCCIVGGGPAGIMAGFLLARRGVEVVVLEKHADFLRDFRGDTIHPSTLDVIHELGLLDDFLKVPHDEVRQLSGLIGPDRVTIADFTGLPTHCKFLVLMPQWDFLDFMAARGKAYPTFRLMTNTAVTGLIERDGRIAGVHARTAEGPLDIEADLVIAADGRHSVVRAASGLPHREIGAPMDVLWMRLSRRPDDPTLTFGRIDRGRIMVVLNRGSYWQCAFVIAKGGFDDFTRRGLAALRAEIALLLPWMENRVGELASWDDVKLLTVTIDRLDRWHRPGLLCIGDAAHAMSPVGGVGINLAIQDAVATANLLAAPLLRGTPTDDELAAVQRRRMFPTRATQALQVAIQKRVISRVLANTGSMRAPWLIQAFNRWPVLQRLPARIVGVGFRPEHVER